MRPVLPHWRTEFNVNLLSSSVQVQGLGTALKILFSGKFDADEALEAEQMNRTIPVHPEFKLRRSEIVSLFNGFGR